MGQPAIQKRSAGEMLRLAKQVALMSIALVLLHLYLDCRRERSADAPPTAHFRPDLATLLANRTNLDYYLEGGIAWDTPGEISREDLPVAGSNWLTNCGAELETAGKLAGWLRRKSAGEDYFEIPNYPLDDPRNLADANKVTHLDVDLRRCLGQVRDQLKCGSCYAFAWNSLAEWHYCRQTGKLIDFSEQHMIDCGDESRLQGGCVTGSLDQARDFSDEHGFHLESDYPYKGKKRPCSKLQGSIQVQTRDFTRIKVDRAEWEQVLKEQPILVSTRLPFDIQAYQRGIHPADNCQEAFRHGMLLVGYGRDQGRAYWLLRNSSGASWGENGYLRLARDLADMNKCFATAFVAKFRFKQVDEEDYYKFEPQFEPSAALPSPQAAKERRLRKASLLDAKLA